MFYLSIFHRDVHNDNQIRIVHPPSTFKMILRVEKEKKKYFLSLFAIVHIFVWPHSMATVAEVTTGCWRMRAVAVFSSQYHNISKRSRKPAGVHRSPLILPICFCSICTKTDHLLLQHDDLKHWYRPKTTTITESVSFLVCWFTEWKKSCLSFGEM